MLPLLVLKSYCSRQEAGKVGKLREHAPHFSCSSPRLCCCCIVSFSRSLSRQMSILHLLLSRYSPTKARGVPPHPGQWLLNMDHHRRNLSPAGLDLGNPPAVPHALRTIDRGPHASPTGSACSSAHCIHCALLGLSRPQTGSWPVGHPRDKSASAHRW